MRDDLSNPYLRADSLIELLSWEDVDFVRCAYVTVLGRQPDSEGEAYYAYRIRQGHSKLQVLWQLRKSPEAVRHDPGIAGFDRALKKSRWERSWLGFLIRPFTGGEGDGPAWRRHRALANEFARRARSTAPASNRELVADLQTLTAEVGRLAETVAGLSPAAPTGNQITADHQLLENRDYRHLSASSQKVFRRVYARSH